MLGGGTGCSKMQSGKLKKSRELWSSGEKFRVVCRERRIKVTREEEIAMERIGPWAREGQGWDFRLTPFKDVGRGTRQGRGGQEEEYRRRQG